MTSEAGYHEAPESLQKNNLNKLFEIITGREMWDTEASRNI
jgi:hypothetical protein